MELICPSLPALKTLHIRRSGGTRDDLDQFSRDDGLTGSVVEDLELADHVACVFGCVLPKEKKMSLVP